MCGIFGYYTSKNIKSSEFLRYLKKRGPDEKKVLKKKNLHLAQRDYRLEILKMDLNHFTINKEIFMHLLMVKYIIMQS